MTLRKILPILGLMVTLASCGQDFRTLDNLGSHSDFSDLDVGDDFEAPEDEEPAVLPPSPESNLETPTTDPESPIKEDPVGQISPIESLINTFFFENKTYQLAHNSALKWGGCKASYKSNGGYNSDSRCGTAFIEDLFADNLNETFYQCVTYAAEDAGYPKPKKIFINHLGSYNDRNARNSTKRSNHAYARALDIKNFNMVDETGQIHQVSTLLRDYVGKQAVFYDAFRDCWKQSLPSNCRPGNSEYLGSIGHKSSKLGGNTLHNDHIHLSLPLCAGPI